MLFALRGLVFLEQFDEGLLVRVHDRFGEAIGLTHFADAGDFGRRLAGLGLRRGLLVEGDRFEERVPAAEFAAEFPLQLGREVDGEVGPGEKEDGEGSTDLVAVRSAPGAALALGREQGGAPHSYQSTPPMRSMP